MNFEFGIRTEHDDPHITDIRGELQAESLMLINTNINNVQFCVAVQVTTCRGRDILWPPRYRPHNLTLYELAVNSTLPADYFQIWEVLNNMNRPSKANRHFCHFFKRYLFSVLVSIFLCFYSMTEREAK